MPAAIPLLIAGASAAAEGFTVASMVGAAAAVGGGSAILGGVVLAGSALSTLGMITGSQKLQRIGGIVGLVGGVGAIANGLASAGSTLSQVAEQSAKEGATAFEHGAGAYDALGQTAAATPVVGGAPGVADAAAQAENAGQIGIDNAASGGVLGKSPPTGVIGSNAAPGSPVKALLPGSAPVDANTYAPNVINGGSPGSSVGGALGKVGSFVKQNKELANVAGGIVTGAMSDYNKQKMQQRAYDMQQQAILADRARQSGSVMNLQMPGYLPPVPVPPKG